MTMFPSRTFTTESKANYEIRSKIDTKIASLENKPLSKEQSERLVEAQKAISEAEEYFDPKIERAKLDFAAKIVDEIEQALSH